MKTGCQTRVSSGKSDLTALHLWRSPAQWCARARRVAKECALATRTLARRRSVELASESRSQFELETCDCGAPQRHLSRAPQPTVGAGRFQVSLWLMAPAGHTVASWWWARSKRVKSNPSSRGRRGPNTHTHTRTHTLNDSRFVRAAGPQLG